MHKVAIIGASGFTGAELLRICATHVSGYRHSPNLQTLPPFPMTFGHESTLSTQYPLSCQLRASIAVIT